MGRGLVDGQHLVERVEVAEGPPAARPGQRDRDLGRGAGPARHSRRGLAESAGVMGQQLVHPLVHAAGDRPVGGQQPGVGQLPDLAQ